MADTKTAGPVARPLSPHLTIYRWPITMAMSIAHRATGIALYAGTLLLVWWLVAAASGAGAYGTFQSVASSWFGKLVLFGYTWALIHHMLGGIRHFVWDLGAGFEPGVRNQLAWATLVGSVVLTVALWLVVIAMKGI